MKNITLLLLGLFLTLFQINAQVEIGTGNLETENGPFEAYFGFSYVQTIYLASEINATGDITDIQWYYSGTSALPNSQDLIIYMAEVARTEFADTNDWEPIASFTQVYAGGITVTAGAEGWVTITLDTPFTYAGTGNLIVAVEENSTDYDAFDDDFYNTQVTTNRSITYFSDTVNPDPTAPPTASNIDDTIANIILGGITQACPTPSNLTATGVTSDEAVLSWTENGSATTWNIEIVPEGSTQTETPTDVGVSNSFTATALTPATNYTYYVQADCGSEVSSWAGPFAFATECVTFTAPYIEDFENGGTIPLCWTMDGGEDWFFDNDPAGEHIGNDGVITGTTASNGYFAWCDSSGNEGVRTLTSPLVDVSALAVPALSFYLISDNEGNANSNLDVEVWDGAAWNSMATYNTNTDGWVQNFIDLSTLTITGDVQARFIFSEIVTGDFYDDIAIDDVRIDEAPTCFDPTALTATAITATTAQLSWSQDGTVSMWNVEIVTSGTAPTGVPTATGVPNPYTAMALTAITEYDYYVQADCGGGDVSGWAGPFTFTTECVTFIAPYTEGFENAGTIPDCWTMDGGEDWFFDNDPAGEHIGNDGVITGSTATNGYFAWCDSSGNEGVRTLTSPVIDVSALAVPALSFYLISDNEGNANSNLDVEVWDGAAWNSMETFNTNTNGWELKIIGLSSLTFTGDAQVRFIFSEIVTGDFYDDIAIDDVTIDEAPACIVPGGVTFTNNNGESIDISWTSNNGETSWEYVVSPDGTGEPTAPGTTVGTNSISEPGLDFSTTYEFWVRADCGADGFSDWAGPFTFTTPVQTNFILDCVNDGPLTIDYCYGNDIDDNPSLETFTFTSSDGTPLNLTFNSGEVEDCCDELVVLDTDGTELLNDSVGDVGGLTFQSSGDTISFYINSDGSVSCESGAFPDGINYTVSCATCINPQANYSVVDDCANGDQFLIDVDITSLGDATSLTISNNIDANTVPVAATGVYQIGPFPFLVDVIVTISNDQDVNCVINSPAIQLLACPPENNNPCDATVAVVNDDILCEVSTPGTILAASPSGVPDPSCGSSADDDVWFQFVAVNESHLISLANIAGSTTTDVDHSVYGGTCDNLTEISCVSDFAELSSVASGLTVGETYFVRVYSGGDDPEDTTFDLCITPYNAPGNIACDTAANFCSGSDTSDILYSYNTIGMPDTTSIDCLGTSPNPTYSVLEIGTSGDILIEMVQNSAFDASDNPIGDELDVDFILWGPYGPDDDLCVLGSVVDCSYSAAPVENVVLTGAVQGEIYLLLITNFEAEAGVIQVRQTNVGDPGSGSTIADIEAEITSNEVFIDDTNDPTETDEVSVCGFDSVTIETDSPFADEFVWFEDGFEIVGETSSTLTVPIGGFGLGETNYQVLAFDSQCNANTFSQIVIVNLYQDPGTLEPQSLVVCDGPVADGEEDFDLDAFTTSLGYGPDFTVSYYTNMADANQAMNPVSTPYTSSGENLIIRVEDTDAANNGFLGCRQLSELQLVVNANPVINQPMDLVVCDDADGSVDGSTEFDLTSIDSEVTTDANVTVTYHMSQDDADNGVGASVSPYLSSGETVFVRAEDDTSGCYSTTSFNLAVNVVPLFTIDTNVFYYDEDAGEFLLCTEAESGTVLTIIPNGFSLSDVSIQWLLDGVDIAGATGLSYEANVAGEYSTRVTFNATGCSNIVSDSAVTVVEIDNCTIPEGISPGVSPGFNDNFDLRYFNVTRLDIFNRNGTLVYSKRNYSNEWIGQTNDGEELPVGTYFYTMTYEGGTKQKSAWVYINR
ncbi:fibronectin type III domain-containing protein [Winogradskyella luteola]|nr:fibronectin type III domain-containing protein [Winogradskyella luteola]